jgi:hypothetical protein
MASSINFKDVSDVIILFKDGQYLKFSEETLTALSSYEDLECIKINGIQYKKVANEEISDED